MPNSIPCVGARSRSEIGAVDSRHAPLGLVNHGLKLSREDGLQKPEFGFFVFFRDLEIREAFSLLPIVAISFGVREGNDLAGLAGFIIVIRKCFPRSARLPPKGPNVSIS